MKSKIIVVGSLNYDIILKQERLPVQGETYVVESATVCSGGKGANQAVQSAKLGANVYMVGAIGNDAAGTFLRDSVKQYEVCDTYISNKENISGMGIVSSLTDGVVYANIVRGANYDVLKEDIDSLDTILKECKIMILQLEIPISIVEYSMKKAKKFGLRVIFNAAPSIGIPESMLELCDYIIVNEVEASFYFNQKIETVEVAKNEILKFAQKKDANIIITLGKLGAVVCNKKEVEYIEPYRVDAIETTGAGDSFVGGLAYSLLLGYDIFKASKFATCCSALTVCGIGAQPSMPTLFEVNNFIASRKIIF